MGPAAAEYEPGVTKTPTGSVEAWKNKHRPGRIRAVSALVTAMISDGNHAPGALTGVWSGS